MKISRGSAYFQETERNPHLGKIKKTTEINQFKFYLQLQQEHPKMKVFKMMRKKVNDFSAKRDIVTA